MALDDASDPFQQVVYLQEGDAPPERVVVSWVGVKTTVQDGLLYFFYRVDIRIINASDFSVYKEYALNESDYFNGGGLEDHTLISDGQGIIFILTGDVQNNTSYYRVIKIDTNTDNITTLVGPPASAVNDKEPQRARGVYMNGYIILTDSISVVKIDADSMTEVSRQSIPAQSWTDEKKEQSSLIVCDETSCFMCECVVWGNRITTDKNRFNTRIYEINPTTLSLNQVVDDNFYTYIKYFGYITIYNRGGIVIDGVPYFGIERYDQTLDDPPRTSDQIIFRIFTNNGYQYDVLPALALSNYGNNIEITLGSNNGNLLCIWGESRRKSSMVAFDPPTGNVIKSKIYDEWENPEVQSTSNYLYLYHDEAYLEQVDPVDFSIIKSLDMNTLVNSDYDSLRKNSGFLSIFNQSRYA